MNNHQSPELQLASEFVQYTHISVFLTGKAGTGKTTFLHHLRKTSLKRMIVVAPTGIAAINAGGVTIHSFFQISFGPQLPTEFIQAENTGQPGEENSREVKKFSREKINIIKSIDLLVIDEISMVRADLLDAIDAVLRRFRNNNHPFGGVQLLMIGDIQQLAPVVKEDEWKILRNYYDTVFFFSSKALRQTQFVTIELKQIFRQNDMAFIEILNKVRDNKLDTETLSRLNSRYKPGFNPSDTEGYIILTTHNAKALEINNSKLEKIKAKAFIFNAIIEGEFPEYAYPTEAKLVLKAGSQVMFVKNDLSKDKRYFNGKIGMITGFYEAEDEYVISVKCPGDNDEIAVSRAVWENTKYSMDEQTKEIRETVIGTFEQFPLKLAWAITIHKSQGLTFDRAIIDARAAFAHGQVYVALSRCRTIDGLILSTPVSGHGIINDPAVAGFASEAEKNAPGFNELDESKKAYRQMLLKELFDFQTIQKQVNHCKWLLQENRQIVFGNIHDAFEEMSSNLNKEIIAISEKFGIQLNTILNQPDNNELLQERVRKACSYFENKLSSLLLTPINNTSFETDNKEVRKTINQALERLHQAAYIKLACLKACMEGFEIKNYLEARAKASVELPVTKHKPQKQDQWYNNGIVAYPVLYNRLASWRARKAVESNEPAHRIVKQRTLISIANSLPQTAKSLALIKGFGKKKIIRYGNEILNIINAFCREHNIEPEPLAETNGNQQSRQKPDSRQLSYELWKSGLSIQQIAAERGLAISTIEGHLAYFVGTGDIDIHQLVHPDKAKRIADYFLKYGMTALKPVKEALGDEVSYSELRFVLKSLETNKSIRE